MKSVGSARAAWRLPVPETHAKVSQGTWLVTFWPLNIHRWATRYLQRRAQRRGR